MAPTLQPLSKLIPIYMLAVFWGTVQIVKSIWSMLRREGYFHMNRRDRRPEIMDDSDLGIHHFVQLSSVKLHYVAAGDTNKPLMLFLHGFPECWFSWRFQLKKFKENYRVVAVDMRGYGESDKPKGVDNYWLRTLSGDVKELIQELGYEKCILVVHDWGGIVGYDFVLSNPDMVEKFIICNIPHPKSFYDNLTLKQLLMSWYIFFFQLPYIPEIGLRSFDLEFVAGALTSGGRKIPGRTRVAVNPEELEAFKYSMGQPGCLTAAINYYRGLQRYNRPNYPYGMKIKVPGCMIWGVHDFAISKALGEGSIKYFDSLKVHWVDTAGHWVQQEEPEKVNEYMEKFLEE